MYRLWKEESGANGEPRAKSNGEYLETEGSQTSLSTVRSELLADAHANDAIIEDDGTATPRTSVAEVRVEEE